LYHTYLFCVMILTGYNTPNLFVKLVCMRYVKCLFCENRRKRSDFLCVSCRSLYGPYDKEVWFFELVKMEKNQRRISRIESTNYDVDFLPKESETYWGSFRQRGRPKTTELIESYIRSIYKEEYSVRQITKLCNSAGLVVSRESVRFIINRIKLTKK
jgi:hypothetical protein